MKHTPLSDLRVVADVDTIASPALLSRRERLERWAEVLEREPERRIPTLQEIEFAPRAERHAARADGSALSVAFADPVLRSAGLEGDTLGQAVAFFDLTENQAHRLLCSCLNGRTMLAGRTAERIRAMAESRFQLPIAPMAVGGMAAAVPLLVYLFG